MGWVRTANERKVCNKKSLQPNTIGTEKHWDTAPQTNTWGCEADVGRQDGMEATNWIEHSSTQAIVTLRRERKRRDASFVTMSQFSNIFSSVNMAVEKVHLRHC